MWGFLPETNLHERASIDLSLFFRKRSFPRLIFLLPVLLFRGDETFFFSSFDILNGYLDGPSFLPFLSLCHTWHEAVLFNFGKGSFPVISAAFSVLRTCRSFFRPGDFLFRNNRGRTFFFLLYQSPFLSTTFNADRSDLSVVPFPFIVR